MILVRRIAVHAAWLAAVTSVAAALAFLLAAGLMALVRVVQGSSGDAWMDLRGLFAAGVGTAVVAVPAWLVARGLLRRLLAEPGELGSATHALASLAVSSFAVIVGVQLAGTGASLLALDLRYSDGFTGSTGGFGGLALFAAGVVGLLVWVQAAVRRTREVAVVRPAGIAAGLTRLGFYGPLVYFVAQTVSSVSQTLTLAVGMLDSGASRPDTWDGGDPFGAGYLLLRGLVPAALGAIVLVPLAWYARRLVGPTRPFADEEVASLVRRGAWAVVALSTLGWVLAGIAGILTAGFHTVFDVRGPLFAGDRGPAEEAAVAAVGLLPALLIGAIGWRWHRGEVIRLVPEDPPRAARTWGYALAWSGLGFAAVGAAQAIALLVAWMAVPGRVAIDGLEQAATALPYLLVGAAAWSLAWWRAGRRLATDPREARSTARRTFLAGTVISGFVAILVGLPWALAQVLERAFGAPMPGLAQGVALPAAAAIVGAVMACGALLAWVRDDEVEVPGGPPPGAQPPERADVLLERGAGDPAVPASA